MRGLTGNQSLILVDGIRLNNAIFRYGPNQYMTLIDPYLVEKIEVIKGTGSVQHGSYSLTGVINNQTTTLPFGSKPNWQEKGGKWCLGGGNGLFCDCLAVFCRSDPFCLQPWLAVASTSSTESACRKPIPQGFPQMPWPPCCWMSWCSCVFLLCAFRPSIRKQGLWRPWPPGRGLFERNGAG